MCPDMYFGYVGGLYPSLGAVGPPDAGPFFYQAYASRISTSTYVRHGPLHTTSTLVKYKYLLHPPSKMGGRGA